METGWQTVLRARSMTITWRWRRMCCSGVRRLTVLGGWVELDDGECWFVHSERIFMAVLCIYSRCAGRLTVGRVWENRAGDDGERAAGTTPGCPASLSPSPTIRPGSSDNFTAGLPGLQWQWQANPNSHWLLPGTNTLNLRCVSLPQPETKRSIWRPRCCCKSSRPGGSALKPR